MLARYKNIIILSMSFDPDQIIGTIDNKPFSVSIQTDPKGQYIIIQNKKIYLSEFKLC